MAPRYQGFYIYRARRASHLGTWFRLSPSMRLQAHAVSVGHPPTHSTSCGHWISEVRRVFPRMRSAIDETADSPTSRTRADRDCLSR